MRGKPQGVVVGVPVVTPVSSTHPWDQGTCPRPWSTCGSALAALTLGAPLCGKVWGGEGRRESEVSGTVDNVTVR